MKCLVAVKQVVDPYVSIIVKSDGSGVDTEHAKMVMNPFDEIALEEAVKFKDNNIISEVVAVSIGGTGCTEVLRRALARGANKAIWVNTASDTIPLNIAKILVAIAGKEQPDLIFLGKQAIDNDSNQVGQMLAALLAWSQGTFCSKIAIDESNKTVIVTREVDSGLETCELQLPAVLTADLRLNEPGYITLPKVMQAKRMPIEELTLESLSLDLGKHVESILVEAPAARKAGVMVEDVKTLVDKLKNEAKVL